ncbi:contractile injection system tape measure protein [Dickeya sp. CSL RW240]|uniref:contractile injection system tape measure protein n=1 Tax=Dickeya sp. CSL RW240 TaxID=1224144 RepID=UPI0008351D64|nr:contractile injection system tape measure protein [Dickeya sp. CSL RW240]
MTQPHRIDTVILTFDVDSAALASQLEQQAPLWVKQSLLVQMDALFGRISPPHQHWVMDQLTLDLGVLHADDIAQQAAAALERQLSALWLSPPASAGQTPADGLKALSPPSDGDNAPHIAVWDDAQVRWQQLAFFLQHGVMPWHYPGRKGWYQDDDGRHWLAEAVRLHHTRLERLLRTSAHPATLLTRLVSQLPASALSGWLARLEPTYQTMALRCLAAQPETASLPAALRLQLHHYWHQHIHQALMQRRLRQELLPLWPALIGAQRLRFQLALYACSQQPEVIRAIVQALDDTRFDDVLMLLAPQARPFIRDVIRHPHWFAPAQTTPAEAQPEEAHASVRHHLREFTLHYLLVQRGSHFNKRRYMAGLVARLAAHHNLARTAMLHNLHQHLMLWQGDSALRQQLLSLLAVLWEEMAAPQQRISAPAPSASRIAPHTSTGHDAPAHADIQDGSRWQWWQHALQQGDEETVNQLWQRCHSEDLPLLHHILLACGQTESVRQLWVTHFSESTRERLLNLLEPAGAPFISQVITDVQASSPPAPGNGLSATRLAESLWSLTLSYLLAARGSEFNRRVYLQTLLRQLAAHHNLSYHTLLDGLRQYVQRTQAHTALHQALLSVLTALADEYQAQSPIEPAPPKAVPDNTPPDHCAGQGAVTVIAPPDDMATSATPPAQPAWRSEEDLTASPSLLLDSACYQYLHSVLCHASPARRFHLPPALRSLWLRHDHREQDDLLRCLCYLQLHNPLLLQRWQVTSADYPERWQRLSAALRPSQAMRVVMLLLQLRQPALRPHPIARALDDATRTLNPTQRRAFYGEVMAQLADNRLPDWAAIRADLSRSAGTRVALPPLPVSRPRPAATTPVRSAPSLTPAEALTCLTRFCDDAAPQLTPEVIAALRTLLAQDIDALCRLLLPCLRSASTARQLASRLPESLHTALLSHRCRDDFMALYPYARLITNLCLRHPTYRAKPQTLESLFWYGLYQALPATGARADIAPFISRYLALLGEDWQQRSHASDAQALYRFLLEQVKETSWPAMHRLAARLQRCLQPAYLPRPRPLPAPSETAPPGTQIITPGAAATPAPAPLPRVVSTTPPDWRGDEALPSTEPIVVTHAGLVLLAPYLPCLFTTLTLVQQGEFCGEPQRYQALACLHYLVDERQTGAEYQLALNKLLCGMPLNAPLPAMPVLNADTRDTVASLLDAVRQHWQALGHTSSAGLRQTFLQREGCLWRQADSWRLEVMPGPFDMLIDHLPWGFSTLKYPWMTHPLHVVWR